MKRLFLSALLACCLSTGARAQAPINDVVCGSAVSGCVLLASPGQFFGVYAECTSACWLMVFNSTTVPSNGATTAGKAAGNMVECIDIAAAGHGLIQYQYFPLVMNTGISVAISSTACATLTLSAVGFIHGLVQ